MTRTQPSLDAPANPRETCTLRITTPTFNAEFITEVDAGPCTRPAVARLTTRHDGTSCDCNGRCLVIDPDSPDTALSAPWTEIVLMCTDHAHEYESTCGADMTCPASTYEVLA
ncbi:hypothetical protein [Dactylosporangium sp. NPDC006015]|uniref:hypothetical protein n=1 Tax=Dactylosporangium sp. NPDC006015 TaxID=3154576 RepID=UPI0033AA38AD